MFSETFVLPSDDSTFETVQLPDLEYVECADKGDTSGSKEQLDSSGTAEEHQQVTPSVQHQQMTTPVQQQQMTTPVVHQHLTRSTKPTSDASMSRPNSPKSIEHREKSALNKGQKRRLAEDSEAEILQMVTTALKEDEFSIWGRAIGYDLSQVNRDQYIIAKKMISETIFYASLNMLQPNTGLNDLKTT